MISSKAKPKSKAVAKTVLYISLIFLVASCNECPTEPEYDIYLSVEEVLSTSVMIKVTLPDSGQINHFELDRNDSTIATYSCLDDDTLITDNELIPDTKYTYQVRFLKDDKTKAQSEAITIHTLATTSHDFVWEIDTLGIYGSYLKDAWIVDEDDIWVVGNIVMPDPDSSWNGTGRETFNAAHWNGKEWEYIHIKGNLVNDVGPLYSIWYFDSGDIWVTSHCFPIHWDGNEWTLYHIQNMGLDACAGNAIWASSPNDIYFVGRKGSIVHYDGSGFEKVESGTEINLRDIYGIGSHTFAVGSNTDGKYAGQSIALHRDNSTWETIRHEYVFFPKSSADRGKICTVWAHENYFYYIDYSGLMRYDPKSGELNEWFSKGEMYGFRTNIIRIRGNALNDIIHVNNWAHILHYNGESWQPIDDVFNQYPDGEIDVESMDFRGDIVTIVGFMRYYSHAAIGRGYRN